MSGGGIKGKFGGFTEALLAASGSEAKPGTRKEKGSAATAAPIPLMRLEAATEEMVRRQESLEAEFGDRLRTVEEERDRLRAQVAAGKAIELQISDLRPSQFQTGGLDERRVSSLVDNLRENPLNSPIVVRRVGESIEIIAGHHRVEAFKRLGKDSIAAVFSEVEDEVAAGLVFFDNLISPRLADLAKFRGYNQLKQMMGSAATAEDLAKRSGESVAVVKKLMLFARLPEGSLEIIERNPDAIGYTVVATLVQHGAEKADRVLECLELLVQGKLRTTAVAGFMMERARKQTVKAQETVVKRGKHVFARVVVNQGRISISLKNTDATEGIAKEVADLLERAAKAKS